MNHDPQLVKESNGHSSPAYRAKEEVAHLQAENATLKRLLAQVADCLFTTEIDSQGEWRTIYLSPVVERLTGRPPEFFHPKERWLEVLHPDDRHVFYDVVNALLAGQPTWEKVFRYVHTAGGIRWIRASIHGERQANGVFRLDGILSDITERKKVEDHLRDSEKQYRDLVETCNDLIFSVDEAGRWTFVNRNAARRIYGYEPEEMLGRPFTEFLAPENIERDLATFARIKDGEPHFQYETVHLGKDGRRIHLIFNAILLRDEAGQVCGTTGTATDITQKKEVERAYHETEQRFNAFMDNSPAVAFVKDDQGRMLYINRRFEKHFQVSAEQALGKYDYELWPEEVARSLRHNDLMVLDAGRVHEFMENVPDPDGLVRHWLVLKFPFMDETGRRYLGGVALDMTDKHQAQQAMQRSEARYRLLFERNQAGVFRSTVAGRLLDCNESLVRILGFGSREDLLACATPDLYQDPADREGMVSRLRERPWLSNYQVGMRRRDGSPLWALENVSLLHDPEWGEILEGTIADITALEESKVALRASEAKYRCLVDNLDQCIFLKDREHRFIAANQNFCRALGVAEEQLLGKTDYDYYPRDLADKYRADDLNVLGEGRPLHGEEETLCLGQLRTVRINKTPVKDDRGHTVGVLGIFWDITDQIAMEAQLRHVQKMDALGQLAGGIAHDFNNLLTVILGSLSLVLSRRPTPEIAQEQLRNAEQASLRAAELTQRLLGFARRTTLSSRALDLRAAIDEAVGFLRRTIDPRIELAVQGEDGLWAVKADPGQVNQVLMNLALNARDAMPQGGRLLFQVGNFTPDDEYLRLHLEARPGHFVQVRVQDSGCGMTAQVRQRIFEPFFTTKDLGKGTGLGLATVFSIVKQHRGWITCLSAPGQGTAFDVFLPRHDGPVADALQPPEIHHSQGHETIMVVDDEPMIRNLADTMLRRLGYTVLLAEDGRRGLEIYQQRCGIDLVILDGTMPRLSGMDTLRELVRFHPEARVLFSSGFSMEPLELAEFPQVLGYLNKPYRVEDLALKVREALDHQKGTTCDERSSQAAL